MELLDAEFKKTLGEVNNLTRSTMMQSQRDLMNMLNEAEMRVAAGVQSYSAAVCDILDQYGRTGVMIDYPTGTRRTLEAAVRMCVVTSMNQTAAQVTNHYIAEHNVEYVLVSAHLGARTQGKGQPYLAGHDNWQGRCYKISGSEPDAPNLAETTGYDIVNGTGHVLNPLGCMGKTAGTPISPGTSLCEIRIWMKTAILRLTVRRTGRYMNCNSSKEQWSVPSGRRSGSYL